jgi:hypothetical protein
LTIASAETSSARAAASSLSKPLLREFAGGLGIADDALGQAANSPIEPTL